MGLLGHIIYKDYIVNRQSFIYCSLACRPTLEGVGRRCQRSSSAGEVMLFSIALCRIEFLPLPPIIPPLDNHRGVPVEERSLVAAKKNRYTTAETNMEK